MINSFIEMFSYSFMVKAFICGILISFCASLIGVTLVLKRNSMIGDGLSHVGFGAFAIAAAFGFAPLWFAIPVVIILSFFVLQLNDNTKIHGDAAIGLLSASSLAIGTFVISIVKGVNTDINSYLFGSILSISDTDIIICIVVAILITLLYIVSYNKIFAITFDERFAKSIGIKTNIYNMIFASLCSVVVVLGMRLMGALLISSLIILPTLSSWQCFNKFKSVIISSVIISITTFIIGLTTSYMLETPTGSTIVITNLIVLIITMMIKKINNKIKK